MIDDPNSINVVKTRSFGRFWVLFQFKLRYWGLGVSFEYDRVVPAVPRGIVRHLFKLNLRLGPVKLVFGFRRTGDA